MPGRKTQPTSFKLFAPYNERVSLLGSWNDWKPIPMERDERGVWWVDVPLDDGEYEYKFEVVSLSPFASGKVVYVADPEAMRFTLDSHENSLITVKKGKPVGVTYKWKHNDVPLPNNHELIIYEMHIGDFNQKNGIGTFKSAIEKLDYLAELGINAVELMPVNEFPGHHSWGYSQRSIYAVENSYGVPDDLCRFVDECHKRGIRVIHDAVYNHMEADAPLTQIDYNYWFYESNPDGPELDFGPKFNFEHCDENLNVFPAREHVINALRQWIEIFHIDGIRFDATRAIKYYDLLAWFNHEARTRADMKPFLTIAEHIPQDPTIADLDGPTDAAWHDNFMRQMVATTLGAYFEGRDPFNTGEVLRLLDGRGDGFASPYNTVHYINNHDQQRIMWLMGELANTFDEAAFRRAKLGATLLITAPGIPMLWMGEEFGQANPKSLESRPLQWDLLKQERNQNLFNHYKHLIHLRKSNPALRGDTYEVVAHEPGRGIIGFKRWNDEGNIVVVAANLTWQYGGEFGIGSLEDGTWHEAIYGYDVEVQSGVLKDVLAESEAKVYIRQ